MKKYIFSLLTKSIFALVCFSLALIISSCPTPINEEMFLQVKDVVAPGITILSPTDGSSYAAAVLVQGIVSDGTDGGAAGLISSLEYKVLATGLGETVSVADDGLFSFSFSTAGLSGSLTVQLIAYDWNGNETTMSIQLVDQGSMPSFTAAPGNHEVILEWDDVPLSESYTLLYTTNGTLPSDGFGISVNDVTSPHPVSGLKNGDMHVFRLRSNSLSGADNESGYVYAIPLSPLTLAPSMAAEYQSVVVSWNGIDGTNEFEVFRSDAPTGPYANIAGTISGTSFVDNTVQEGQGHYYKVRPAMPDSVVSIYNYGEPTPIPNSFVEHLATIPGVGENAIVNIDGDYLYSASNGKFHIFGIQVPGAPTTAFSGPLTGTHMDISASGNYVCVSQMSTIQILDVSTKSTPNLDYTYTPLPGFSILSGIYLEYPDLYFNVTDMMGGMKYMGTADITTSTSPIVGDLESAGIGGDLYVENSILYGTLNGGMAIYDVNDSSDFVLLGTHAPGHGGNRNRIFKNGNYVYTTVYGLDLVPPIDPIGIDIVDVTDPALPGGYGQFSYGTPVQNPGLVGGIDRYIVYSDETSRLQLINASDITDPYLTTAYTTPYPIYDMAIRGDVIFASVGDNIEVFRFMNPQSTVVKDTITPGGQPYEVVVRGGFAYTVGPWTGVSVFNVSNPDLIVPHGEYALPVGGFDLEIHGPYLFVAAKDEGLYVLNISDPAVPTFVSATVTDGEASGIELSGDYAYVAIRDGGVAVFEVSDPVVPELASSVVAFYGKDVLVQGDYAYVASTALVTLDIRNPETPVITDYDVEGVAPRKLALHGDTLLVGTEGSGLDIYDISDPSNPALLSPGMPTSPPTSITQVGNLAYLTSQFGGLEIIDVSHPELGFRTAGVEDSIVSMFALDLQGRYAYIARYGQGFTIVDLLGDW